MTLIVLALVAVAVVRFMGTLQQGSEASRKVLRIDDRLDAALIESLHILHDDRREQRTALLAGSPIWLGDGATQIRVAMTRDNGRIDVNAGHDALLRSALAQNVDEGIIRRLADLKSRRSLAFDPLELLSRRLAFADDGARLMSLLTVYSGQRGINPFVASDDVLKAVPDIDEAVLRELRDAGGTSSKVLSSAAAPYFSSGTDVVTIVATSLSGRSRAMTARIAQGTSRVAVLAVRGVPAPKTEATPNRR